jgi:hypothetical protein
VRETFPKAVLLNSSVKLLVMLLLQWAGPRDQLAGWTMPMDMPRMTTLQRYEFLLGQTQFQSDIAAVFGGGSLTQGHVISFRLGSSATGLDEEQPLVEPWRAQYNSCGAGRAFGDSRPASEAMLRQRQSRRAVGCMNQVWVA